MNQTEFLHDLVAQGSESLIVPLLGSAEIQVTANSQKFHIDTKDACYLPPGDRYSIRRVSDKCEIIWSTAPAKKGYPAYLRKFTECKGRYDGSAAHASRRLNTTIIRFDKDEKSERLRAGYTDAEEGNWTSFPPHRHDAVPEVYIFAPAMKKGIGLQMVWTDSAEDAYMVRAGDAVGFNEGYHPNVGDPTTRMNFLWIMSSDLTTDSTIHPDYVNVKD
ncbi:MAG: 5-deoxy-glucuronate isomerase [Thaumarchaeota archaeon]|nr:5-deoxy-glucuronate isomerase [Nitrososphaerota archaeon]